jgi:hypothetical protein
MYRHGGKMEKKKEKLMTPRESTPHARNACRPSNSSRPEHGVKSSRCREGTAEKKKGKRQEKTPPSFHVHSEAVPAQKADYEMKNETR